MQFVSAGSESLCGYAPKQLIDGSPCWADIIHPEDRAGVWHAVQAALYQHEPFEVEYRIVTRSDATKWVSERGRAVGSDEQGLLIDGYITDITAAKQQQEALQRSESALTRSETYSKAILNTALDSIMTITARGQIETVNKAFENLLGYSASEVIGKHVSILLRDAPGKEDDHHLSNYFDTFGVRRELTLQRKDGSCIAVQFSVSEILIDGSRCFVGIARDLSEQKASEDALRRQHEQLDIIIEQAPMGIVTYRFDETFLSVNRAFCDITGYTSRELQSMTVHDLTHVDDRVESAALATQVQAGQQVQFSQHKRYVQKGGAVVDVRVVNAVTHDASGRLDLVVGLVEDLTPRRRAEAEARTHREQLAHVDRLNMLGEMTAGIAHEINQPLTAISLFAQAGKRFLHAGSYERMPDIFDKLSQHAQRAGAVIERVRTMVQQRESAREDCDCIALITEVVRLAEAEARIHDIVIEVEAGEALPLVAVDAVQIQQVALNLLRNGMEAMRSIDCRGGNTIKLQLRLRADGDVEVSVVDTGCGVSEGVAKELFKPFETTKESGMGMGLSISRAIISAHGGQLQFHNNDAGGATFSFALPAAHTGDQND